MNITYTIKQEWKYKQKWKPSEVPIRQSKI